MENFVPQDFSFILIPQIRTGNENNLIKKNFFLGSKLKTIE